MLSLLIATVAAQAAGPVSKASPSAAVVRDVLSVDRAKTILEAATSAAGLEDMERTRRVVCSLQANPEDCERTATWMMSDKAKAQAALDPAGLNRCERAFYDSTYRRASLAFLSPPFETGRRGIQECRRRSR